MAVRQMRFDHLVELAFHDRLIGFLAFEDWKEVRSWQMTLQCQSVFSKDDSLI